MHGATRLRQAIYDQRPPFKSPRRHAFGADGPPQIRIRHIWNTYNNGSLMMAANVIQYLAARYPNAEFHTDAAGSDNIARLRASVCAPTPIAGVALPRYKQSALFHSVRRSIAPLVDLAAPFAQRSLRLLRGSRPDPCDTIVVLGGDDLSMYYGAARLCRLLFEISSSARHKHVVLLGQTIGPFSGLYRYAAQRALADVDICTRDLPNYQYLSSQLQLPLVRHSYDIAFLDLPGQQTTSPSMTLARYGLAPDAYVTIVPSGLSASYTPSESDYIDNYLRILRNIRALPRFAGCKVVLLPHVARSGSDDLTTILRLREHLSPDELHDVVQIANDELPLTLRHILGSGIATITGRMHAAVSTYQMGKPAICLSYSVKFSGALGDALDVRPLIVECAGRDHWSNGKVASEVVRRLTEVLPSYDDLCVRLRARVAAIQDEILRTLDTMFSLPPSRSHGVGSRPS